LTRTETPLVSDLQNKKHFEKEKKKRKTKINKHVAVVFPNSRKMSFCAAAQLPGMKLAVRCAVLCKTWGVQQ